MGKRKAARPLCAGWPLVYWMLFIDRLLVSVNRYQDGSGCSPGRLLFRLWHLLAFPDGRDEGFVNGAVNEIHRIGRNLRFLKSLELPHQQRELVHGGFR